MENHSEYKRADLPEVEVVEGYLPKNYLTAVFTWVKFHKKLNNYL